MQNRLASAGLPGLRMRPGSVIQDRLASTGLLGPCERPVTGYGGSSSGNLDNASIRQARCRSAASNQIRFFA